MVQPQQPLLSFQQRDVVRCTECHAVAEGPAEGWRAYLTGGYDGESVEVVIYCVRCAAREVGEG